jgi:pyruvate dehydrogenase E1 component alpha subunit
MPMRAPAARPGRASVKVMAVAAVKPIPAKKAAVTAEEASEIYRDMVLGRRFEDACAEYYYR